MVKIQKELFFFALKFPKMDNKGVNLVQNHCQYA